MSGDRYVLDSAGVRTLNATIARVRNLPGNPLNLNSRHRQVMTEATAEEGYNGYFKVVDASTEDARAVRVINGSNPQNSYCGHTDLGDYPATTLNYTLPDSGMLYVYLTAKFNETSWKYELGFLIAQEPPESPTGYWLLANINPLNVKISQVWTGGAIYWGDRYYI